MECIYNDGQLTTIGDHVADKDGYCIICGEYLTEDQNESDSSL